MLLLQSSQGLLPGHRASAIDQWPVLLRSQLGRIARQPTSGGGHPYADVHGQFPDAMTIRERPGERLVSRNAGEKFLQRWTVPSLSGVGALQLVCDKFDLVHFVSNLLYIVYRLPHQ